MEPTVTEEQDKDTVSVSAGLPADARQVLADQLVEQAKTDGISLTSQPSRIGTRSFSPTRRPGCRCAAEAPEDFGPTAVYLADPEPIAHTGDTIVVDGAYSIF